MCLEIVLGLPSSKSLPRSIITMGERKTPLVIPRKRDDFSLTRIKPKPPCDNPNLINLFLFYCVKGRWRHCAGFFNNYMNVILTRRRKFSLKDQPSCTNNKECLTIL